jgi:4'-phosphopantetheinyl transferase
MPAMHGIAIIHSKARKQSKMSTLIIVDAASISQEDIENLSPARLEKAKRCVFEKDRRLSLAAGIALSMGLKEYGLNEKEEKIIYGHYGKPYLKNHPSIFFSLSHSHEKAIAYVSQQEVGCDIERKRECLESVVKRHFSLEEKKCIENAGDKSEAFTRIWVAKESFLKALGLGVSAKLSSFSCRLTAAGIILKQSLDERKWVIEERKDGDYFIALCKQDNRFE